METLNLQASIALHNTAGDKPVAAKYWVITPDEKVVLMSKIRKDRHVKRHPDAMRFPAYSLDELLTGDDTGKRVPLKVTIDSAEDFLTVTISVLQYHGKSCYFRNHCMDARIFIDGIYHEEKSKKYAGKSDPKIMEIISDLIWLSIGHLV